MTQERMHPEDRLALMAASLLCSLPTYSDLSVRNAIGATDRLLAELARAAKQEAPKEWPKEALARTEELAASCERQMDRAEKAEAPKEWPEDAFGRIEEWAASCDQQMQRAEKAEARVKELESYISVLVHGERNNDLVFALWNETCGGASADKAAADLRSMIANLENNLDNSKARVKELEDAIRFHRECWDGCVYYFNSNPALWAKVK